MEILGEVGRDLCQPRENPFRQYPVGSHEYLTGTGPRPGHQKPHDDDSCKDAHPACDPDPSFKPAMANFFFRCPFRAYSLEENSHQGKGENRFLGKAGKEEGGHGEGEGVRPEGSSHRTDAVPDVQGHEKEGQGKEICPP